MRRAGIIPADEHRDADQYGTHQNRYCCEQNRLCNGTEIRISQKNALSTFEGVDLCISEIIYRVLILLNLTNDEAWSCRSERTETPI
jgi:hypothetical protein